MTDPKSNTSCPLPLLHNDTVLMAHGGGGTLMHQLLERVIIAPLDNALLASRHDASIIEFGESKLAFTTDSFVVNPLFFPGGDIGKLAVFGTVNDLAMAGARPLYLSLALIIEEGFQVETLSRVVESIRTAAIDCGVKIVTGDTKVVERGKGDGLFINTAGIGILEHQQIVSPASVCAGDAVILSGDIGRHGIAIMSEREDLGLETAIESDCGSLHRQVQALLAAGIEVHCLRDLTRGGLASALVEIAQSSRLGIEIEERAIAVSAPVQAACELLGFDPLHVANEGRFVAIVPGADSRVAIKVLNTVSPECSAQIIGYVQPGAEPPVVMISSIGARRIVNMLSGEQLPRIC